MLMSMPKITVIIEGEGGEEDEYCGCFDEQEVEITCPVATHDEVMNDSNKEVAIQEHGYGPAQVMDKRCGNCGYFNQTLNMLDCIETGMEVEDVTKVGYCTLFHFVCSEKNTCDSWMKGGPITNYIEEEDVEETTGRRFI